MSSTTHPNLPFSSPSGPDGPDTLNLPGREGGRLTERRPPSPGCYARSKRSRFITLVQAATKSRTNFSLASSHA